MKKALIIIAACEVIRIIQNGIQLFVLLGERTQRKNAYQEFVESLKNSDGVFVRNLLEEFERAEKEKENA